MSPTPFDVCKCGHYACAHKWGGGKSPCEAGNAEDGFCECEEFVEDASK